MRNDTVTIDLRLLGKRRNFIVFFAVLSLWLSFSNYGVHGDLIGGDAASAFAIPGQTLETLSHVFLDGPGLGSNGGLGIQGIPVLALAVALKTLFVSSVLAERVQIALYLFVGMLGAYFLARQLLRGVDDTLRNAVSATAALLFSVNHYSAYAYSSAQTYYPLGFICLPWIVWGVIAGCERKRGLGILAVSLGIICAGGAATNAAQFGVALFAVVVAAILVIADGVPARRVASVALPGLAFGLLCCAWWELPFLTAIHSNLGIVQNSNLQDWLSWMSQRSSFARLFKLDGYTGGASFPFASWYSSPLGNFLGYVPLAIAMVGFGVLRRRLSTAALLMFLAIIFLAKGTHEPFGNAYGFLSVHVPGFAIFRSAYDKWTPLAGTLLSMLFALGLCGLSLKLENVARSRRLPLHPARAIVALAAGAVVFYMWPFYGGKALNRNLDHIGFISTIPPEYYEVGEILHAQGYEYRTLIVNPGGDPYPTYSWRYFGQDPLVMLARSPIADAANLIPDATQMPRHELSRILQALSVRYLVLHHDITNPVDVFPKIRELSRLGMVRRVFDSSALAVYELTRIPDPIAHISEEPIQLQNEPDPNVLLVQDTPYVRDPLLAAAQRFSYSTHPYADLLVTDRHERLPVARTFTPFHFSQTASGMGPAPLYYVPNNPSAITAVPKPCASRPGVLLTSSSVWYAGEVPLPQLSRLICLPVPTFGRVLQLDGQEISESTQFTMSPGRERHVLTIHLSGEGQETSAKAIAPTHFGDRFLVLEPQPVDAVKFVPPYDPRRSARIKVTDSTGATLAILGARQSKGHTVELLLTRALPALEPIYISMNYPARTQSLPLTVYHLPMLSTVFSPNVGAGFNANGSSLSHLSEQVLARNMQQFSNRRLRWHLFRPIPKARLKLNADGSGFTVSSTAAGVVDVSTTTHAVATDTYRLDFAYRTDVPSQVIVSRIDGAPGVERDLRGDSRPHRFTGKIQFPDGSDGTITLRFHTAARKFQVAKFRLVADSPNGRFLTVQTGSLALTGSGEVVHSSRPVPWVFHYRAVGCNVCVLVLNLGDSTNWISLNRFARRLPAQTSFGGSAWLLSAREDATGTIVYLPGLLEVFGVVIALISALLLLRYVTAPQPYEQVVQPAIDLGYPAPWPAALALVVGGGAFVSLLLENAASAYGDATWALLLVFALANSLQVHRAEDRASARRAGPRVSPNRSEL